MSSRSAPGLRQVAPAPTSGLLPPATDLLREHDHPRVRAAVPQRHTWLERRQLRERSAPILREARPRRRTVADGGVILTSSSPIRPGLRSPTTRLHRAPGGVPHGLLFAAWLAWPEHWLVPTQLARGSPHSPVRRGPALDGSCPLPRPSPPSGVRSTPSQS